MAITIFYSIRKLYLPAPLFYGGVDTWVNQETAQLFTSKEDALNIIPTLPDGDYMIHERVTKS